MGNINISTARTKAYANEQRTINNEHYSKQTQSNPISTTRTPCPAYRTRCRLGCEGVWGSVKTVLYSGEGSGSGLEFFFGWRWILYGFTGGVGIAEVRKWRGYGRGSGDWRARKGLGGVIEAARVNRTALSGRGKAGLRGGYYAIGGVQSGFFG